MELQVDVPTTENTIPLEDSCSMLNQSTMSKKKSNIYNLWNKAI